MGRETKNLDNQIVFFFIQDIDCAKLITIWPTDKDETQTNQYLEIFKMPMKSILATR